MSHVGLKAVVDFLYGAELLLDGGNIDYVLEAAHLLQVRISRSKRRFKHHSNNSTDAVKQR